MKNKKIDNILRERPRKKNNKKVKDKKRALELACDYIVKRGKIADYMIGLDTAHSDIADAVVYAFMARECTKPNKNKILLNIGLCEKPQPMSKVKAFIIIALTLLAFVGLFKLTQRAMDIHALNTCEQYGDCAEVIRDTNAN